MATEEKVDIVVELIDKATNAMKGIRSGLETGFEAVKKGAAVAATAIAAASAAAVAYGTASVMAYSDVGDAVEKMAKRTGLAAEDVSALRVAADASGTSIEAVEIGIKTMQKTMTDASTASDGLKQAFEDIDMSVDDLFATGTTPAIQFELMAAAIGSIEDPSRRVQVAMDAFGKAGADLIPLFEDGNFSMAQWNETAKKLGVSFTEEGAAKAARLNDAIGAMKLTFEGFKLTVGGLLAEPVAEWLEKITENISKFREQVEAAGGIVPFVMNKIRDTITQLLTTIEENTGLVTVLTTAWERIATVFNEMLWPALVRLWEQLKPLEPFLVMFAKIVGVILYGAFLGLVQLITVSVIVAIRGLTSVIEIMSKGVEFVSKLWNGFIDILAKVVTWIDKVIEKIKQLNVVQGVQNAVGNVLGFGGARANGGPVLPSKAYLVGEEGPELFVPPGAGTILPNRGGMGVTVVINNPMVLSNDDIVEKIGNPIVDALKMHLQV